MYIDFSICTSCNILFNYLVGTIHSYMLILNTELFTWRNFYCWLECLCSWLRSVVVVIFEMIEPSRLHWYVVMGSARAATNFLVGDNKWTCASGHGHDAEGSSCTYTHRCRCSLCELPFPFIERCTTTSASLFAVSKAERPFFFYACNSHTHAKAQKTTSSCPRNGAGNELVTVG